MAIVRHLEEQPQVVRAAHTETECTYSVVTDSSGNKYLQIDTYGSPQRKLHGKKSQSIRFSISALQELRQILARHFA
jgi:hypothetical protein